MSDIFQVGDVVYHPALGRGVVEEDRVQFDNGVYSEINFSEYPKILSFSPWPEPNHVRPLKDGVYKVMYGGEPWVLCFLENVWYFVDSSYTTMRGKEIGFPDDVNHPEFLYSLKYHS